MNSGEITITGGMVSSFLLELVKFIIRKAKKNMDYDFPLWFYGISLPVMNALMPFVLVYGLGIPSTDPVLSMDVLGVVRYVVLVLVGAGISVFTNTNVNKPVKEYLRS